jgi:LDH2 family malate/lactate/ureidoglycolate dehydrogenase
VTHDIQGDPPQRAQLVQLAPRVVLRALGFGTICQAWGGLLTGLSLDPKRMLFTFKISLFADPDAFKREVDEYARQTRRLQPLEGTRGAHLPGGIEVEHEQAYRRSGVPLSKEHQHDLEKLADELRIEVPWR